MARLNWNANGERFYSAGVDRGVFYPQVGSGVAWNGLVSVTESEPDITEVNNFYDGQKFYSDRLPGTFAASIEAFTYPVEFEEYDGSLNRFRQQQRKPFGLCYREMRGNDSDGLQGAYILHLVYNALVEPSEVEYETVADDTEPTTFNWAISTKPERVEGFRPSSHVMIDTSVAYSWAVEELEAILYGSDEQQPRLPSISELLDLFENASILLIVDHGDGSWTASGPDSVVKMLDDTTFQINWPTAVYISEDTYTVRSL